MIVTRKSAMSVAWSTLQTEKKKKRIHVVSQQTLLAKNCTDVLPIALPTGCKKRYTQESRVTQPDDRWCNKYCEDMDFKRKPALK